MWRLSLQLGEYHPLFIHFPVVFSVELFVLEILILFNIWKCETVACWLSILMFAFAFFSVTTGWYAATNFVVDDYLSIHRLFGFIVLGLSGLLMLLKIAQQWRRFPYIRWVNMTLVSLLLIITILTGDFGGIITRGATPFFKKIREKITIGKEQF